mmetsp:Transcript_15722/g.28732  ORF Transcript_15722/g.28732 Transcript_15722/m.28732 type:complete len:270 (+) Transcript_15722:101-910(+)
MNPRVSSLLCTTAQVLALDALMSKTLVVIDSVTHEGPLVPTKSTTNGVDHKQIRAGNGVSAKGKSLMDRLREAAKGENSKVAEKPLKKKHEEARKKLKTKDTESAYEELTPEMAKSAAALYFNLNRKMELKCERLAIEASKKEAKMFRKKNKELERMRQKHLNKKSPTALRPLSDFERPYEIIMGEKHYIRTETRILSTGEHPITYTQFNISKATASVATVPLVECVEKVPYELTQFLRKSPSLYAASTSIEKLLLAANLRAEATPAVS